MVKINNEEPLRFELFKENLDAHEDIKTFVVKIKHQQNGTWQGEVLWAERQERIKFRSELELLRILDSAYTEDEGNSIEKASS
ncbi:MAG: hypothetical protein K6B41_09090 [Butyrivibrio sp.]|nr:hypothetical protein [Butyrivibrio sp.]